MSKKNAVCLVLCLAALALLETVVYQHYGNHTLERRPSFCLNTQQAQDLIAREKNLVIVDVRTANEFSFNALPHSLNMPLFRLRKLAPQIAQESSVLIVDLLGIRSTQAYKILRRERPDLKNIYYLKGNLLDLLPKKS